MLSPNEKSACKRKKRFSTSAAAEVALKKINPTHKLKMPTRVYKCPVCAGYHLTSQRS
jgi:hypothetical protein